MKPTILYLVLTLFLTNKMLSQDAAEVAAVAGAVAITIIAADANKKEIAKQITQFRSKEYIMNNIIGAAGKREVKFETESLASDNSAGLISVAFNCDEVNEKGLLLAFFGDNIYESRFVTAYAFRYLPLQEAQDLLGRLEEVKARHKDYLSDENDVNNVYIEFEDIKFILYRESGDQIRVFWNGFEVIWEKAAFNRTKRRLDKWFD